MDQLEAIHILASADRQIVVRKLFEREGEASITEISKQVAAERHQTSPHSISDNTIERAQIRLVHNHLPRMIEAGLINKNDNMVSLINGEGIEKVSEVAEELEPWASDDLLEH